MSGSPTSVQVDLWAWSLDVDEDERGRLASVLSEDETVRAQRFVFERDHHRFVAARGRLREILAHEVRTAPEALRFSYSEYGKPSLTETAGLHFNLSHSETLAALAVSRGGEIGLDVECIRPLKEDIAERFFSRREAAALKALPEREQLAAFYRCWTRKEAVVKAIGDGLSHPLDSFDVTLAPDTPASIERFEGEVNARHVWRLAHFDPAIGYVGAIACRTGGRDLVLTARTL